MTPRRQCFRVPISWGDLHAEPIISAFSPDEARARALAMAEDLLRKRIRWRIRNGRWLPEMNELPILAGEPILLHAGSDHR